jgi:hypothetical protein
MAGMTQAVNELKGWGKTVMGEAPAYWGKVRRTFGISDPRARMISRKVKQYASNGVGKSKEIIGDSIEKGTDAGLAARRTWAHTEFSGKTLGYHAMAGAGIGAALGGARAYSNGQDPGRGAMGGAFAGAVGGLASGIGTTLYKGYGKQNQWMKDELAAGIKGPVGAVKGAGPFNGAGSRASRMPRTAAPAVTAERSGGRAVPVSGAVWSGEADGVLDHEGMAATFNTPRHRAGTGSVPYQSNGYTGSSYIMKGPSVATSFKQRQFDASWMGRMGRR